MVTVEEVDPAQVVEGLGLSEPVPGRAVQLQRFADLGGGLSPVADLPANWDTPLPPGGFWVLNVASLSASSPSAPGVIVEEDHENLVKLAPPLRALLRNNAKRLLEG